MIQRKTKRRRLAFITACLTAAMAVLPYMPERAEAASGDQVEAWGDGWHFYCIDGHTYATNGVCTNGDLYEEVSADTLLNEQEQAIVFWAMLSFKADKGDSNAQKFLNLINVNAAASGLMPISKKVNEEDLKGVIHSAAVRAHYPWLDFAVAHAEDYMKLMGVLGGGSTNGGGKIPSALQGSTSLATAVKPVKQGDAWVIQFDPNGADADFISKVPLQFLAAGSEVSENGNWVDTPSGGWNVVKTSTQIRFTNPDPNAAMLNIRFNPQNTDYESVSEQFSSPQEMYVSTLQTVKPVRCSGKHKAGGKTHPIEEHQRNADLMFKNFPVFYFASLGGSTSQAEGSGSFQVFRHEEDMEAHYNVRIHKYDYETGKPLEKARFNLYERFDDKDQVNQDRDGHVEIYEGGDPYASYITHDPAVWSGFRLVTSLLTDQNGQASYTLEKGYHYDKTFCNGHPAPELSEVPEEETDPETGEVLNGDAIEDAKAENREAAQEWLDTLAACEEKASGAFDGVHFHWLSGNVNQGAIEDAASSGEKTSVGSTSGASGEESYERSGAKADCEATYEKFISLEYSYTFKESTAREGYTVHGAHTDDVPIEIITTDSSENGANARFEGGYSSEISRTTGWQLNPPEQAPVPGDSSSQKGVGLAQGEREETSYYGSPYLERIRESVQASLLLYPSDSLIPDGEGTPSELKTKATISEIATDSDLIPEEDGYGWGEVSFSGMTGPSDAVSAGTFSLSARSSGGQFDAAYSEALSSGSVGDEVDKGDDGNLSHGVTDSWKVYDHRTEGEVHFNKKDLDLAAGEDADFDAYGETEGDGTLEGAVYGLFAREDIVHPDGKTGVVFEQNDLVAVASTDKNGDGSFVAITEAPGHTYDYETGQTVETESGWAKKAPGNLFTGDKALDDYTEDGSFQGKETKRIYQDNLKRNGNPWIGRPLLLGKYYIKELSRSEGYELSVNGKDDPVSNQGYDLDVTVAKGEGSVAVTRAPYVEPQSSGMDEDTMPNVLHFTVRSEGTKDAGFDLAFTGYPEGTKLYRLDSGTETREEQVPTGEKEKKLLYDAFGDPVWKVAEEDGRYPKLEADGSFQTEEVTVDAVVSSMPVIREGVIDVGKTENTLTTGSDPATGQADRDRNQGTLTMADGEAEYLKYKLEQALRANGFATPKENGSYTTRTQMAYDRGSRNGEDITYGAPVTEVLVPKESGGSPITIGDALLTLLDYYSRNGQFTYGGLDGYEDGGSQWVFRLYAGFPGNPEDVYSSQANGGTAYHRVEYLPDDPAHSPRYVYADYTADGNGAFGKLENFQTWEIGGASRCSATLVTDVVADGNGDLHSKTVSRNVYFQKGEILTDQYGNRIQDYEWVDKMTTVTTEVPVIRWSEIPVSVKNGVLVAHMDSRYTDGFGAAHSDENGADYTMKAVLPKETVTLSKEDAEKLPPEYGYQAGEEIGYGDYVLAVSKGTLSAYLDFQDQSLTGDGLYVEETELTYPGQDAAFQDGGTRTEPVQVYERPIRQKVKITKDITSYDDNTYGIEETGAMPNFRFKAYLKSNLERLYRDEEGKVVWLDKNGNELSYEAVLGNGFPEALNKDDQKAYVGKKYTKVPHNIASTLTSINGNNICAVYADPETADKNVGLQTGYSTAITLGGAGVEVNAALYSFRGKNQDTDQSPSIRKERNEGYTRILETQEKTEEGKGTVYTYNYKKFFDVITVANTDKWDDQNQTYTSWKPLGNAVNRTEYAENNAKSSDMVRQFAIQWYLDDEVAKLVGDNGHDENAGKTGTSSSYTEQLYDEALNHALEKAYDYLKPFFAYDLDEIYAVPWDGEENGGTDLDPTTLSADIDGGDYYYGISKYLPYGTYVITEQQPHDFLNKHYEIDSPKELQIPTVYEKGTGENVELNKHYYFDADQTLSDQAKKENYLIRFGEEWNTKGGDQREYVIQAHNRDGDFEVYKYGLEPDKLTGSITYQGKSYPYLGFSVTQELFDPLKDYYNPIHEVNGKPLTKELGANENSHYYADDSGGNLVEVYYHYASISEQAGNYQGGKAIQGVQTAYEGIYAPMLVPYSIVEPQGNEYDPDQFIGYADKEYHNTLYHTFLRIEKLDSETHESILHDDALFMIYKAQRDEATGSVKFYEEDTTISGTKVFLEAMGAEHIQPVERSNDGTRYSGIVKAGTPICREEDKITMPDATGEIVGEFEAFSTTVEELMKQEDTNAEPKEYRLQTTGYLRTPQPLGAGTYVLCEIPPEGYVRTAPIAIEVYSDKVTYYKEGNQDQRVHAAIYESDLANGKGNDLSEAQIFVENVPIKLEVQKQKATGPVTFKVGKRVEGSLTEIGGNPELEYAYENGRFLGYAYPKGTLEYLTALKNAGENVEIVYDGNHFAGYGYVTRERESDDDENPFVTGAKLTLYDAIELIPSGDTQDHAFEGLTIHRSLAGNVLEMFVQKGFAGEKTELVKETDSNGEEILTDYIVGYDEEGKPITEKGYVWKEGEVERPDTDILFYDLDSLSLTWTENIDGKDVLFGWDKDHQKVMVSQLEADKENYGDKGVEVSLFAFKDGQAYLEFVGGDFTKLRYDQVNKALEGDFGTLKWVNQIRDWKMSEGTVVYHLDREGNRDAMVDPQTGMAYILEPKLNGEGIHVADRVLVWPVNLAKDQYGNVIARDKITTSRIATIGENEDGYQEEGTFEPINQNPEGQQITDGEKPSYSHKESGYINGSWKSAAGEESHKESTLNQNNQGQNMNGEILTDDNNGDFLKYMDPVYDEHGLVLYYQRSDETYDKGTELYDRNGDFVRYKDSDNLETYNQAAYALDDPATLHDGREDQETQMQDRLYHRNGESYILENTWITSDKTPNDPFHDQETDGQADLIKRLPAGTYILEELEEKEGYAKAIPTGITVEESSTVKRVQVVDDTTKTSIDKIDAPGHNEIDILDMDKGVKAGKSEGTPVEYGYDPVEGAQIALFPAKYVIDVTQPEGYRLEKTSDEPFVFATTNSTVSNPENMTASWTTGAAPIYVEGLPEGYYILEETEAPEEEGFVKAAPVNVHITGDSDIQNIIVKDDHTKVAIWKYELDEDRKQILPGAEFALYEARLDQDGNVIVVDGMPQYEEEKLIDQWISSDATDYTESINLKDYPNTSGKNQLTGFQTDFEKMYEQYGVSGTGFTWSVERNAKRDNRTSGVWRLEDGSRVVINGDTVTFPESMSQEDREGFKAAYEDMLGEPLELKWAVSRTARITDVSQIDQAGQKYPSVAIVTMEIEETGRQVLINARYNGNEFSYSYKFDYQKLNCNDHANSWLTADGMHRIDYLPVGKKMVLVETKAPEGFALAAPRIVEVEDVTDVQLHDVLNEKDALLVDKVSSETGESLAGSHLALYQADETGRLTISDQYLIEEWISGNDGVYDEYDKINGMIPEGFQEGDLKPHAIYRLADGTYFLVEKEANDYYCAFDPIEIHFAGGQQIQIVEAVNRPAKGKLVIKKTDENGGKLSGVVFELSAFDQNGKMVEGFPKQISDTNGIVTISDLPVGQVQPDGQIVPYTFKLKELVPPEGYAANSEIYTFQFPNGNGDYSEDASLEFALYEMSVKNEKTKLYIEKKDLDNVNDEGTDGIFMDGAVLAIYQVSSITEEGEFHYRPEDLFERWTTSKNEGRHMLEGLVAGQSYVLVEEKAPEGYTLMDPVLFTVSSNGRHISELSQNRCIVKVHKVENEHGKADYDAIAALTVKGRIVQKTEIIVLDEQGTEVLRFAGTNGDHVIRQSDGLKDGEIYTFEEHTVYSDGSDVVTAKITRRVHFEKDGFIYHGRTADRTLIQVSDKDHVIREFYPLAENLEQTIDNQLRPENPIVVIKTRNGEAGEPVIVGQPIINTITYYNPSPYVRTVMIEAVLGDSTDILDPYDGQAEGKTIRWVVENVAPYTQGTVSFAAAVSDKTADQVTLNVKTNVNGISYQTVKTVPIQKDNRLTIYHELTGSGKELYKSEESTFQIRLWNEKGEELSGKYAYVGSKTGFLKSGDAITLAGNEYITIDPYFTNCRYEVIRAENGLEISENHTEGTIAAEGSSAWFTREVQDKSERQIFVKGGTYFITETTEYSDQSQRVSKKFSFTLNDDASISTIGGYDRESKVVISKQDIVTGEELPGNQMEIIDSNGKVVASWISGSTPYEIVGKLVPGQAYILRETLPKDGYSYAKDIPFTVNEDGSIDQIIMENKPTHIVVSKQDITNSEELPGAHLELVDENGVVIDKWISGSTPHEIVGKLISGKTYVLRETIPADGFVIAKEIVFQVSLDGSIDQIVMKDDTTKVRIYKNEYVSTATGSESTGKPISGSVLQILNEDKTPALYQGKEIIFTTRESFYLLEKVLVAGKSYWLHEVEPAPGYGFAEDVKFTVSKDGSIDVVVMEDKKTEVIISKKDITGSEELPGNHLQLVDEDGVVIDEWISGDTPHRITGKLRADHKYTLIEKIPLPGYAYAKEITFTVNHDGTPNYVEMRNDVTKVEILKVSAGSNKPLAGAEFALYDQNGQMIDTWISTQEPHKIYGTLIAGETYILRELKAPAGYVQMEDILIKVNDYDDVLKVVVENRKNPDNPGSNYVIRIKKIDGNGNPLPGASLKAADEEGNLLSVTKEENGTVFKIAVKEPQTITISELAAPGGYSKLDNSYQIAIPDEGAAVLENGDSHFYQDRENSYVFYLVNDETPVIPPLKGTITASYDYHIGGLGKARLNYDGSIIDLTAKTGDDFPIYQLAGIAILSLIGLVLLPWQSKQKKSVKDWLRKKKRVKTWFFVAALLFITAFVSYGNAAVTFAAEKAELDTDTLYREKTYLSDTNDIRKQNPGFPETLTVGEKTYLLESISYQVKHKRKVEDSAGEMKVVTSAPFTDEEENHIPDSQITENGKTYYLKSYHAVETVVDAREEPVSDTIEYTDIPVGRSIPEAAKLSVKDSITGKNVEVQVPLMEKEYGDPHWIEGFEFPIKVSNYNAHFFDLNGIEVTLSETMPLNGYEKELLQMIGVSESEYRIDTIQWDGGTYTENGVLCRNLKAIGDMLVADCTATYAGVANLPAIDAKSIQATYTDKPIATSSEAESSYRYTVTAKAKYVINQDTLNRKTFWDHLIDFLTNPVVVAVMLLLLLVIIIIWLIGKKKKAKEEKFFYISDDEEESEN